MGKKKLIRLIGGVTTFERRIFGGFRVDMDVKPLKEINKFKIKNKYINNKKIEQYKTIYISLCFLF